MSLPAVPPSPAAAAPSTKVGMGIDLQVPDQKGGTQTISLLVPDVSAIGASGDFAFQLDPDTTVSFTFADLYAGLGKMFTFLPDLAFSTMPEPISTLATTVVAIKRFSIEIKDKALVSLAISVDLQFNWQVPGTTVSIQTFHLIVDYAADGVPSVTTPTGTPALPGGKTPAPTN